MDEKEAMCSDNELTDAKLTVNYATCDIMAFLYGKVLVIKQFYIRMAVTRNVEDFLAKNGTSCSS